MIKHETILSFFFSFLAYNLDDIYDLIPTCTWRGCNDFFLYPGNHFRSGTLIKL